MVCPRRGHASTASDRNRLVVKFDPASWTASAPSGFGGVTSTVIESPVLGVYNSSTPTTDSAIPAGTLNLINAYIHIDWVGFVEWTAQSTSTAFYFWSLSGGTHSLRYTGGVDGDIILRINGGDVLTAAAIETAADTMQRATAGQMVTVSAYWDPTTNSSYIRQAVNGVYAYSKTGTASGTPIVTPATGYLNSLAGGSPNTDITQVAFIVKSRTASQTQTYEGAVIGDSTIASYTTASGVPVASLLRPAIDSRNSAIKSLAIGGATTAQQNTSWNSFAEKANLQWIVIQIGLNDIDPGEAAAPAITRIQDLVDDVNALKPAGAKVYIATMIPCYQRMITRYGGAPALVSLAKWEDMNDAIAGLGGTPITGVDGRITAHTVAMDDGVGNLDAAYDGGDGIHPNNAGRQVIADAWIPFLPY